MLFMPKPYPAPNPAAAGYAPAPECQSPPQIPLHRGPTWTKVLPRAERWLSGLRRAPGKRVWAYTPPGVRISLSPPVYTAALQIKVFADFCCFQRNWKRFHTERNHQGKGNVILFPTPADRIGESSGEIRSRDRLGGLLRFYFRETA
jgi:hypothetical protein